MKNFKTFLKDTAGNLSIVFAVAMLPVLGVGAVAVDYSSLHSERETLRHQVDSALLAAAVYFEGGQDGKDSREDIALQTMVANGYDMSLGKPIFTDDNGLLTLEAEIQHQLAFGKLIGKTEVDLYVRSQATTGGLDSIEIALVLDNTSSMNYDGKIGALKLAGQSFVRNIRDTNSGARISIVPFNRYVRVSEEHRNASWISIPAEYDTERTWQQATHKCGYTTTETVTEDRDGFPYTYDREICHDRVTTYETQSKTIESRWEGCVGVRGGGLHMKDGGYGLDKLPGLLNTQPKERTGLHRDIEAWCPQEITPLTDDYEQLEKDVLRIYGTDKTYLPAGLVWGMRTLSNEAPFEETETKQSPTKIMVLMSDGKNTAYIDESSSAEDDREAPPYVKDLPEQLEAVQANADTLTLCAAAKESGIEIYTVAFQVTDPNTKALLEKCASASGHYHTAENNEALIDTFSKISEGLGGEIRLVN